MHIGRRVLCVPLALACVCFAAAGQEQKAQPLTVTGKLIRAMAIGGESTGWSIHLEPEVSIGGKQVRSVEVDARESTELQRLENKLVKASGDLQQRSGVEVAERLILNVSSIEEIGSGDAPFTLTGEWLLRNLGGREVADKVRPATLVFMKDGRVWGSASCNRFFGSVEVHGNAIKFGAIGSTRMACAEAVMKLEADYLKALEGAERFEWKDPELLLYCKGFEKALRFNRKADSANAPAVK